MRLATLSVALVFALVACDRTPDEETDVETDTDTDTDTDSDTDTDTDTDTEPLTQCDPPTEAFLGKYADGQVSSTPYDNDAGIDDVIAGFPTLDEPVTVDIQVTGATVAAIGYAPEGGDLWSVWFADANGAIRTYVQDTPITAPLVEGNKVSFRVTEIDAYSGEFEITKIADFTVDDDSAGPVYVQDITGTEVNYRDHGRQVVYTWGRIMTEPAECGGSSVCAKWLTASGQEVDFRVNANKGVVQGDCVEAYLPVGTFDGAVQYNVDDLDWMTFF